MCSFEVWEPLPSNPKYLISSFGRVKALAHDISLSTYGKPHIRHVPTKLVAQSKSGGYMKSFVDKKRQCVHVLVAQAFIGPRHKGFQVNHKDGNKLNNHVDNLEYVTPKENTRHAILLGLNKVVGEENGAAKLTSQQVIEMRAITGIPRKEIAAIYHVSEALVDKIRNNRLWKHLLPPT